MKDSAVLLIDCPDRKGLVARVSGLLYERGANILHADQHQDHERGLFFMRVEWALDGHANGTARTHAGDSHDRTSTAENAPQTAQPGRERFDLDGFRAVFAPLADELGMRWQMSSGARPTRVALFCSQYLHCMADLLQRWRSGELECEIPLVISNHRGVEGLAHFYGIPVEFVPVTAATRAEAEAHQLELLARHGVELVVLARYMQILSPAFVAQFEA
jgi:formyltetrahydrofolate deformylase